MNPEDMPIFNLDESTVTLTGEQYDQLMDAYRFLEALEACGVDNWVGYEQAQDLIEEWDNEA